MKHPGQRTASTWPGREGCEKDNWEELPLPHFIFLGRKAILDVLRTLVFSLTTEREGREGSAEKRRRGD